MKITCPKCSKVLNVPANLAGQVVKCPCGQQMKIAKPEEKLFDPFASMTDAKDQSSAPPPPPVAEWHVSVNGQTQPPCTMDQLVMAIRSGEVGKGTMVWTAALGDWTVAGQVPQLAGYFQTAAPPTPPPTEATPSNQPSMVVASKRQNSRQSYGKAHPWYALSVGLLGTIMGLLVLGIFIRHGDLLSIHPNTPEQDQLFRDLMEAHRLRDEAVSGTEEYRMRLSEQGKIEDNIANNHPEAVFPPFWPNHNHRGMTWAERELEFAYERLQALENGYP